MIKRLSSLLLIAGLAACASYDGYSASLQTNPSGSGVFCQDIRSAIARSACEQRAVSENAVRTDWQEQVRERQERDARIAAIKAAREAREAADPDG